MSVEWRGLPVAANDPGVRHDAAAVDRETAAMKCFLDTAEEICGQIYDAAVRDVLVRRRDAATRERAVAFAARVLTAHAELALGRTRAAAGEEAIDG